jgi:hypothetical protein
MFKKQCGRFEFDDYQKMITTIIEKAIEDYDAAYARVGELNLMQQDLLHMLEMDNINAPTINKIGSKLRKLRIERRELNAKVLYLQKFVDKAKTYGVKRIIDELCDDKLLHYNDCDYIPRIISIDDIIKREDDVNGSN